MSNPVRSVLDVSIVILKTNPATLAVRAIGQVNSGGWTNGRLEPRIYIQFPPDGIQDFDFVADPPTGPSTTVLSYISSAPLHWPGFPPNLKGVRVHAATNALEAMLSGAKSI